MSSRYQVVQWPAMGPYPEAYFIWDSETHSHLVGRYDTAEKATERADELNKPALEEPRV